MTPYPLCLACTKEKACRCCDPGKDKKTRPGSKLSEIAPMHGLARKDRLAGDAYVRED